MRRRRPFGGSRLLIDMSAYVRASRPAVRHEWAAALESELLHVCPIFYVEALYSARSSDDLARLESELAALPFLSLGKRAHETVGLAFRELSARQSAYHRVPPPDALIAAIAHESGVGVLHYDAHYDRLAEVLAFESRWIAPRGMLD